jgi:hypothetical protein
LERILQFRSFGEKTAIWRIFYPIKKSGILNELSLSAIHNPAKAYNSEGFVKRHVYKASHVFPRFAKKPGGVVGALVEFFHWLRSRRIVSAPGAGRLFQKTEKNSYLTPIFSELGKISATL